MKLAKFQGTNLHFMFIKLLFGSLSNVMYNYKHFILLIRITNIKVLLRLRLSYSMNNDTSPEWGTDFFPSMCVG